MSKGDLLDAVIGAGAGFDWITPGAALLSGHPVIAVRRDEQASAKQALLTAGIAVRHEQLVGDQYCFTVQPGDLDRACAVLSGERRQGGGGALWWLLGGLLLAAGLVALVGGAL